MKNTLTINDEQLAMNYRIAIINERKNVNHIPSLKIENCELKIEATGRSV